MSTSTVVPAPRLPRRNDLRSSLPQLRVLTSFRFFAALAVYLHHCIDFTTAPGEVSAGGLRRLLWEGWSGVAFFFVLSGFILAYNYADRITRLDRGTLRGFYVSRLARIYPLHLLTFLVAAVAVIGAWGKAGVVGAITVVNQLTLTQGFLPMMDPFDRRQIAPCGFNGPAWSLSCEAFFYLLFPVLLVALRRRPTALLGVVAAGTWAWSVWLALSVAGLRGADYLVYTCPVTRSADFVVGVCAGLAFLRFRNRLQGGVRVWTIGEVVALALAGAAVVLSFAVPTVLRYASYYVPFWAFVILVFACERGWVSQHLRAPWLLYLGEISFGIYLTNKLVLRAAAALGLFAGGLPPAAVLAGGFAVTLAVSAALFVGYERPARTRVRRWLMPARAS